jgi:hypothetical protein
MRTLARSLPAAIACLAACAAPAQATTFCVPAFHAACPNNGTNVAQANLETALTASGSDGIADRVLIGAHIHTDPDTLEATGTDGIEIIGAGPADTIITSSATTNIYAFDLTGRGLPQSVRDLRIVVPASFPDSGGFGAAAQVRQATMENVDVESRNARSAGLSFNGGGSFRDGALYGVAGGSLGTAISTNNVIAGSLTVERTTIEAPETGVRAPGPLVPVTLRRVAITGAEQVGVSLSGGADATITDSLVTSSAYALTAFSNTADPVSLTARNVTLAGLAGADEALRLTVAASGNGAATMAISDAIIRAHPQTWNRSAPVSGTTGDAVLSIDHSNFSPLGSQTGDGAVTLGAGNLDADPLFAGPTDFRLSAGSPSIDAGDPAAPSLGDGLDLGGLPRAVNATGKAQAIRDQGAYEAPVIPPTPAPSPAPGAPPAAAPSPDRTAPRLSGLRVLRSPSARRAGRLRFTLSETARVTLTFTRVVPGRKPKPVRLRVSGRLGANGLTLRAGRLARGRHRLVITATDAAGNRAAALRRTLTVRR